MNCGEEIAASTEFCPECGASQDPEQIGQKEGDTSTDTGFTSWALGFKPGSTGRNILIGTAYAMFAAVGIPLLVYAYLKENPEKSTYIAWIAGINLIFLALLAISQSTIWGYISGGVSLLAGVFFLPIVRQRLGVSRVPGIDVENSARRSVIVGTIYTAGGLGLIASALPETEPANSNEANQGDSSTDDGSSEVNDDTSSPEFAVSVQYAGSWQGAVSVTGAGTSQSESISGTGAQTLGITGSVSIISINAQKQDDSSRQLTVQILQNGKVVSESSTTSAYGIASASQSF
jgi:hypothetical protein